MRKRPAMRRASMRAEPSLRRRLPSRARVCRSKIATVAFARVRVATTIDPEHVSLGNARAPGTFGPTAAVMVRPSTPRGAVPDAGSPIVAVATDDERRPRPPIGACARRRPLPIRSARRSPTTRSEHVGREARTSRAMLLASAESRIVVCAGHGRLVRTGRNSSVLPRQAGHRSTLAADRWAVRNRHDLRPHHHADAGRRDQSEGAGRRRSGRCVARPDLRLRVRLRVWPCPRASGLPGLPGCAADGALSGPRPAADVARGGGSGGRTGR
jgi:hypothetical protein